MTDWEHREVEAAVDVYNQLVKQREPCSYDSMVRALRKAYQRGVADAAEDCAPMVAAFDELMRRQAELEARCAELDRLFYDHVQKEGGI